MPGLTRQLFFIVMAFPFFYINNYVAEQREIVLDEDTSRHIIQVLRMKTGEQLNLTDGKGNLLNCFIVEAHKKHCSLQLDTISTLQQGIRKVSVAISLIKNTNRFEWFLEKATEIGVSEIIPLICERTEKEKFRFDRLQGICISAMLQSQQTWLPKLQEPRSFKELKDWKAENGLNFIAHCVEGNRQKLTHSHIPESAQLVPDLYRESLICIGPEGDFTGEEIALALNNNFIPVSLGETRLRTETAGVVAATLLCHI